MQGTGKPDTLNIAELKKKHPTLVQMCKTQWRKHYRSLKTEEDKKQARAERAKQTAEKTRIISEHQLQQKQNKLKQASSNVAMKYADGKERCSCKCPAVKLSFVVAHLHAFRMLMSNAPCAERTLKICKSDLFAKGLAMHLLPLGNLFPFTILSVFLMQLQHRRFSCG